MGESDQLPITPLERVKLTIHKDDCCPICKEKFFKDFAEGKTPELVRNVMASKEIGAVHDNCFMPYVPEEQIRILYKVLCYSIGDTIASTPALREIRRMYPRATITVLTFFPEVFLYNPWINVILDLNDTVLQEQIDAHQFQVTGFNSEQGLHFAMHSVEFSTQSTFKRSVNPDRWNYDLCYSKKELESCRDILKESGIDYENGKLIVVHPHGTEWSTRDWGPNRMPELVDRLHKKYPDHTIVSIGGKRSLNAKNSHNTVPKEMKNYIGLPDYVVDLYGKLGLLETAAFLNHKSVKLMVTPDTGALHIASSCSQLPIVGIFTLIKSIFRTPVRNGKFGYKFIGVESESGCNCTYDNRQFTNEANFQKCPKRTFLEDTLRLNIPRQAKVDGMRNQFPTIPWNKDEIGEQLRTAISEFDPKSLPCFPSVDRVMLACEKAIEQWGSNHE